MHDARAVSNFFIDRALANGGGVTSMTLLKVLYFAHAWHLAQFDRPLIAQPFEAWKYGPVVRVVYDQIKSAGPQPLTTLLRSFDAQQCAYILTPFVFEFTLDKFLRDIFDFYSQFHAYTLSDLTHEAGSPWDQIWSEAEKKAVPGMVIPNEKIKSWFSQSGARQMRSTVQRYAV